MEALPHLYVALVTKQASSVSDLRRFNFLASAIKVGPRSSWEGQRRE